MTEVTALPGRLHLLSAEHAVRSSVAPQPLKRGTFTGDPDTLSITAEVAAAPVPATLVLLGTGIALIALMLHRRRPRARYA